MKKTALCFLLAGFSAFLTAQSVSPDAEFGENGKIVTGLYGISGNPYGIDFITLPDGKIILGGSIDDYVGLEKYGNAGIRDTMFSTSLLASDGLEVGVCAQKDGKILMVAENPVGLSTFVARMDVSGNLDPGFGIGGIAQTDITHFFVRNVCVQSDGKVIVFGDEWTNNSSFSALRLLSNGRIDSSFAINGELSMDLPEYAHEVPMAMLEQPDHKLLFVGSIGYPISNILMLRINPDGTRDNTFGVNGMVIDPIQGNSNAYALALQPDGKILVAGNSGPVNQAIVVRYQGDGSLDTYFGNEGVQYFPLMKECIGIALRPDGKILTANWSSNTMLGNIVLAQLLPNGQIDLSFGEEGVFRIIDPGMRPRALSLTGNKATVSARKPTGTTRKSIFRVLLDLNVGTLHPNTPADPALWVYPNPISEHFTLQFGLPEKAEVSVYLFDLQGKLVQNLVQNQSFERRDHTLDLSCPGYLPAGSYVLTMEVAGKKMSSIQIIKK